jgi:outer membrane protein assembly factor BamB
MLPPVPFNVLNFWPLEQPSWADEYGDLARGFTNLNVAASWDYDGTALSVDTNVEAYLNYDVFGDGYSNMTFAIGSVSLWFQPNWTSVADGGNGPTNWAALFSVGNWTSNAALSAWTLAISPEGTNLILEAQSAGSHQVVFNAPIDFDAGDWHSVTITYSSSNCCLFMEGQLVTNAAPILFSPGYEDCVNYGMFVGSLSTEGIGQCHGQLQWLATYDYALSSNDVVVNYSDVASYITSFGGSLPPTLPSTGGSHGDASGGPPVPPGGGTNGGGIPDGDPIIPVKNPGTNLWLLIAQNSNQVVITFSNTIAGSNYLLLAATNLLGPWITNQSLLATSTLTVATPIGISDATALFFTGLRGPPPKPGSVKWIATFCSVSECGDDLWGGGLDASPAISPTGQIFITTGNYLTTANCTLYAIDPIFGDVQWSVNIYTSSDSTLGKAEMTGSAAIGPDGTIYAGGIDGNLYSITPNGATNWIRSTGTASAVYSTPAIGSNGVIYVASDEAAEQRPTNLMTGVTGFNPNGTTNWFFQPQDLFYGNAGDVEGGPVVGADGTVYFVSEGHRLYALTSTGQLKWFLPLWAGSEPDPAPSIAADGSIVVGSDSPWLYVVNPDGSLRWVLNLTNLGDGGNPQIECTPAIGSNGVIYTGTGGSGYSSGGNLYAVNTNGTTNWVFTAPAQATWSSPAIAADGTVYVGSVDGMMYAVTNGALAWSFPVPSGYEIISSPVIAPDGSVIFGSEDGNLYCLWGKAPLATNVAWPMFQRNAAHTAQAPPTTTSSECGAPFVFNGWLPGTGEFAFSMTGAPGTSNWNVYASTNLASNIWTQVGTNLVLDSVSGNATFTDSDVAGLSQRFYIVSKSSCCSQAIGFFNQTVARGTNLIADQLYQVDDYALYYVNLSAYNPFPMNTLNALFTVSNAWGLAQSGTEIYKWNGHGFSGDTNGGRGEVAWDGSGDLTLLPGVGVLMNNVTTSPFTNTFVGLIRETQVFQIQPGTNYLSATIPVAGAVTNITGYIPHNGDTIKLWNTTSNSFASYPYASNSWTSGTPIVGVGQGFVLVTTNAYTWTNTWEECP